MLVSQFMYASYGVGDPARLSAQVISGIGFLGAGTIIVTRRNQIKGLTTAATLWATACMGLAVGVGFYECALVMYVILIFILLLVNVVDTKYLKVPTSTALYLEVRRDVGLGVAIRFIPRNRLERAGCKGVSLWTTGYPGRSHGLRVGTGHAGGYLLHGPSEGASRRCPLGDVIQECPLV